MGGWSNEGIIQDSDPTSPVMCNSTHLTSFAVLVSAEGGDNFQVRKYVCLLYILYHNVWADQWYLPWYITKIAIWLVAN